MKLFSAKWIGFAWLLSILLGWSFSRVPAQDLPAEEAENYYRKWLEQDVKYIITPEEKEVFLGLETPDEKEQFIEQFWFRRDPDPRTSANEFREEHYRRIAYANENFQSGWPGWMTDRGRIYIIHGEPVEIERHPAGERYDRPLHEGGGTTSTYAYEVWRYRSIDGIGSDVLVEFVDDSFTGEYRLATSAQQKDALLHIAEQGKTLTEQMGGSNDDRILMDGMDPVTAGMIPPKEAMFRRMEIYRDLQRPQDLQYKDLHKFVTVDISFDQLPFRVDVDYFRLSETRVLVPVSVEIAHKDLSFVEANGRKRAGVVLYGIVTALNGKIEAEFEQDLATSIAADASPAQLQETSLYQKILILDNNSRYKLDLVVQDVNGSNVGVEQRLISPVPSADGELQLSSIILSESVRLLGEMPEREEMFVLGDVQVVPDLDRVFPQGKDLQIYFQVYGATLDQTSFEPDVEVTFEVAYEGRPIVQIADLSDESLHTFSPTRLVVLRRLPTKNLPSGRYTLKVRVHDRISGRSVAAEQELQIQGS